ncbi:MAG: lipase family protein [Actinomycetota bacterium]|nr:lipase family protein [Actinomycetota bacterium]
MERLAIATVGALLGATLAVAPVAAQEWPGDAPYRVSDSKLKGALACRGGMDRLDGNGRKQPVLLVHGTGIDRRESWGWNYWDVLHRRGFEVCWVQLPGRALGDAQRSSEFVARAYSTIHRRAGEKVDVLGHSQGGLEPRWAIKWFRSGRHVADYISLATPNHGTVVADASAEGDGCFPSCWQMRTVASFIEALNRDEETPGPIHYTNIYSDTDELVQPSGTSDLAGGSNIRIQDICPGRPVDHANILGDYLTFKLVMDALTQPGPARPDRLPPLVCAGGSMPGIGTPPPGLANLDDFSQGQPTDHEPPLKPYAQP